jgi:hypothetical protein
MRCAPPRTLAAPVTLVTQTQITTPARMSTTATVAAPAGTIPQPTTTPLSNAASSWPIDSTAKKRRHRIDFYRRYCIPLDPTDETLSYTEQVTQYEDCISGGSRKVLPLGTYKERLANLVSSNSSLVNQITTKHDDGTTSTETVWTRQGNSYSDSCRVVHSCNIFDAMADTRATARVDARNRRSTWPN